MPSTCRELKFGLWLEPGYNSAQMNVLYLLLVLISAATLAFQVALTRFFSLAQGHHFAFMAVSLALLGAGASGTALAIKPPQSSAKIGLRRLLIISTICFTLSVPAAYQVINTLPFDAYRIAWERIQLLWLTLYYVALTIPFFFAGLVVGATLAAPSERTGSPGAIYAANLLGAGAGPPLALLALAAVGGEGALFLCTLLGWLAVLVSLNLPATVAREQGSKLKKKTGRSHLRLIFFITTASLVSLALIYLAFYPPQAFALRLTPYKSLTQTMLYPGSEVVWRKWNAFSRVDVVRSKGIRSAPGLSFTYPDDLPPQLGVMVDGDNLSPITGLSPTDSTFTPYLLLALTFTLRPDAEVLIIEPGGGLAVLAALQNGARSVTVVQSNHTVAEASRDHFSTFNHHLYDSPAVSLIIDEPRSFLRRTQKTFDLIIFPLTDSFRSVTAGAYTLSEDYRYTIESFSDALARLSPQGMLFVERWLQLPPSESLRLWGTLVEAVRASSKESKDPATPAARLLALRSLQTSLIGAARSPLSTQDMTIARAFAAARQFDLVWLPDLDPAEANRFSIVPEADYYQTFTSLLTAANADTFFANYDYAVAPPTDDHPFFFHFFKWQQTPQIIESLGKTWQPFGGSGYLLLVALLVLVIILSAGLILGPLLLSGSKGKIAAHSAAATAQDQAPGLGPMVRYLLYFMLLGLGFLFIEIPLLQRFILYLGQPVYSFAIVLSALLIASGVGSGYLSPRLPLRSTLLLISLLTIIYPLLLPRLFESTLLLPFLGRISLTTLVLFPVGMLMGVPFPKGLILVEQQSPGLTPWVWAVNGCASVVSAVLASMVALTWGFSAVLWGAGLAYALAALVIRPARKKMMTTSTMSN